MESCILYHGPGAREFALNEASRRGRLLHEPFGETGTTGLKVDEAREFASLLLSAPLGEELGIVVAGPMDLAKPQSADALLKSIEQFNQYVLPILWAHDLGGVQGTIRSRCLDRWCPATGFEPVDEELEEVARQLLSAALGDRVFEIPALVAKMGKSKTKPSRYVELLAEVVDAMSAQTDDPKVLALWERVRPVTRWSNPTQMEVIAAFLPDVG